MYKQLLFKKSLQKNANEGAYCIKIFYTVYKTFLYTLHVKQQEYFIYNCSAAILAFLN